MKPILPSETTLTKVHAVVRIPNASEALKSISGSTTSKIKSQPMDPSSTTVYVFIGVPATLEPSLERQSRLEEKFQRLVKQWRNETEHVSSITKACMHPAYQRIIGMGYDAIPLLLHELHEDPDHWFWALNAITEEDPAQSKDTFDGAVMAWLNWGRENGYI